jgi:hypothetical protein
MRTAIGKIQRIEFGFGGYQDVQIGVTVVLGSDCDSWGFNDFRGHWGFERGNGAEWTETDRITGLGSIVLWVRDLLVAAKKTRLDQLVGVPVEVTFDGMMLYEWRILTEAI